MPGSRLPEQPYMPLSECVIVCLSSRTSYLYEHWSNVSKFFRHVHELQHGQIQWAEVKSDLNLLLRMKSLYRGHLFSQERFSPKIKKYIFSGLVASQKPSNPPSLRKMDKPFQLNPRYYPMVPTPTPLIFSSVSGVWIRCHLNTRPYLA